jgi:colanic acid/amylovoran biosynthesis glycosyltransferase
MRRPELLIMTASFPVGSGEGFLAEELQALAGRGAQLTVVPLWPRGISRSLPGIDETQIRFVIRNLVDFRVLIDAFLVGLRSPLALLRWVWTLSVTGRFSHRIKNLATLPKALWLAGFIQKSGIDYLHAHWAATTATCVMVAADMAAVPWSFTAHRWDIYEDNLLALKARKATFARFISRRGMRDAINRGVPENKCTLIHMGVNLPSTSKEPEFLPILRPLRIICAANLIPVKGHRFLLEAVGLLHAEGIAATLDLAGHGELRNELERHAKSLGIWDFVSFRGQIRHSELLAAYRSREFDVFVLPSIDLGNGEHEGVPVSLMEAMAYNLPVISTQTGSIEELLPRELGATVPGGDAKALAQVLSQLALSTELRRTYVVRQSQVIREWSSNAVANSLLNRIVGTNEVNSGNK